MLRNGFMAGAVLAGVGGVACAQVTWQYEMRIVMDGDGVSPGGPNALYTYPYSPTATQIGFWLQARAVGTGTNVTNWGLCRASPTELPGSSYIKVSDPTGNGSGRVATLGRGVINTAGTNHGRGVGYRNGGSNVGFQGNAAGAEAFPGAWLSNNGSFDLGNTRIYSFDCYVGGTRTDWDANNDGDYDDDGDGWYEIPWRVNGAAAPQNSTVNGVPMGSGLWCPWANLYRFVVLQPAETGQMQRTVTVSSEALLNAGIYTRDVGGGSFPLQLHYPGTVKTASYQVGLGTVLPCGAADLGRQGGLQGVDGLLDNNDFVVFIDLFFGQDSRADMGVQGGIPGSDGLFDNNDFVSFITRFFNGCTL